MGSAIHRRAMMRFGGVMAAALVLAVGCSQSPTDDPGPSGGGGGGSNPPTGMPMPSNGLCNDLAAGGGTIGDQLATTPPALNGGTVVDGRYVLTKYEWYTPNTLHS